MSYNLEQATAKAADYLHEQGIWLIQLGEVSQREGKWVVTYHGQFLLIKEFYTVELKMDTGEIIGFKRGTR